VRRQHAASATAVGWELGTIASGPLPDPAHLLSAHLRRVSAADGCEEEGETAGNLTVMERPKTNRLAWCFTAILALLLTCSFVWVSQFVSGLFAEKDCSTLPPPQVFKNVFGRLPPSGISGIRAAGRIWLGGRNVYLRLRATDEAIHSLIQGSIRVADRKEIRECVEGLRMEVALRGDDRWKRWKQHVLWDEVPRISRPECYYLLPEAPSSTPDVTIIVDRAEYLVYVYLFGI
jgi:hypothetical protein